MIEAEIFCQNQHITKSRYSSGHHAGETLTSKVPVRIGKGKLTTDNPAKGLAKKLSVIHQVNLSVDKNCCKPNCPRQGLRRKPITPSTVTLLRRSREGNLRRHLLDSLSDRIMWIHYRSDTRETRGRRSSFQQCSALWIGDFDPAVGGHFHEK